MNQIKVPESTLEALCGGVGSRVEDYVTVADIYIDRSRWMERRQLVFSYEDKLYATEYESGLTEMQDNPLFERYVDREGMVTCSEVVEQPETITIIRYVTPYETVDADSIQI